MFFFAVRLSVVAPFHIILLAYESVGPEAFKLDHSSPHLNLGTAVLENWNGTWHEP